MAASAFRDRFRRLLSGPIEEPAAPIEVKSSLATPDPALFSLFGSMPSASGVVVSPHAAMHCAPVRCAVLSISEAIGQLPVHLYRRTEGGKERDREHPVSRIINSVANEWTSASQLREQLTIDALLHGHGFAEIVRVGIEGRPVELHRLDACAVEILVDDYGAPTYRVRSTNKATRLVDRANMVHLRSPNGTAAIHDGREAIGLAIVLERHAAGLFGAGGRPAGLISLQDSPPADALARMKAAWQAAFGPGKSGGVAVLENGAKFEQLAFSSVDSEFTAVWNRTVLEIARIFRVPPSLLQDYERATWSNTEQMGLAFVTYTLGPWMRRLEDEFRLKLLTDSERDSYVIEFLTDDLLRSDFETRVEGYSKLVAMRALNPNEVRSMENRPPYDDGDEFVNPNTTSTGKSATVADPKSETVSHSEAPANG